LLKNTNDTSYHRTIIPYILVKSSGDLELALCFAEQFQIESDYVYSQFALQELVIFPTNGNLAARFSRLESITSSISNQILFAQFLSKQCMMKLSPYDYEALLFVNNLILKLDSTDSEAKRNVLVLEMLMDFQRTLPPGQEETNTSVDPEHDIGLANIEKTWVTSWTKVILVNADY
jgi:hypothetical protein